MNIADRIQNLRKTKGISQEELADKLGVSRQAVSKWESEQSVPEIDKVIMLSDFFDVTTDYILKGIETEKQAADPVNAGIFMIVATALNFIGLIAACAIWYEEQVPMALVSGLIVMAVGCMVFGIGQSMATQNAEKAKRTFWTLNVWILAFIPLSVLFNALTSRPLAPYPLPETFLLPVFWFVYIAACTAVVLVQVKMGRGVPRH